METSYVVGATAVGADLIIVLANGRVFQSEVSEKGKFSWVEIPHVPGTPAAAATQAK